MTDEEIQASLDNLPIEDAIQAYLREVSHPMTILRTKAWLLTRYRVMPHERVEQHVQDINLLAENIENLLAKMLSYFEHRKTLDEYNS